MDNTYRLWEIFGLDTAMFLFLVFVVFCLVTWTNTMIKGFPSKWGKIFRRGLSSEALRWVSSLYAFVICVMFKFNMVEKIFLSYNQDRGTSIPSLVSYIIVSGMVFSTSKYLYKAIIIRLKGLAKPKEESYEN